MRESKSVSDPRPLYKRTYFVIQSGSDMRLELRHITSARAAWIGAILLSCPICFLLLAAASSKVVVVAALFDFWTGDPLRRKIFNTLSPLVIVLILVAVAAINALSFGDLFVESHEGEVTFRAKWSRVHPANVLLVLFSFGVLALVVGYGIVENLRF